MLLTNRIGNVALETGIPVPMCPAVGKVVARLDIIL